MKARILEGVSTEKEPCPPVSGSNVCSFYPSLHRHSLISHPGRGETMHGLPPALSPGEPSANNGVRFTSWASMRPFFLLVSFIASAVVSASSK